ncbi:MAG: NADH-ubiquinone oxidoreductase-F iron-sulfur binding region domain-containing protein, partial [Gammaproteobacteria bacterium]
GETPPPAITIRVCDSLSCAMAGSESLLNELRQELGDGVRVVAAPCLGACDQAPAAALGHALIPQADMDLIKTVINGAAPNNDLKNITRFDEYRAQGGYALVERLTSGEMEAEQVLSIMDRAALRGLGGAGFPTARKWRLVNAEPGPRMMAVNADEGEPGTFKDRHYLNSDPHRTIEGMLIAARVVGVESAYIYIRDEYPEIREMLAEELERVREAGLSDHVQVHLRRGAGAYICGEESAMIESIEGKRGLPRHRPPYVAQNGLFGCPTLVNNVETLWWIRDIVERGADWFNAQGKTEHPGPRSYSVSGRVKNPGVVIAPAGSSVRELIELCGGMADDHQFKAYLPGGASGGILPADKGDLPLDFGGPLAAEGCFVGSHAVVVLSDQDDLGAAARNLMRFFKHESCGQCTPCRVGTEKALALMQAERWNTELLQELSAVMADASICGLGQAASNPVVSVIRHFAEEASGNTSEAR